MKENMTALLNAVTRGATTSLMTEKHLVTFVEKLTPRERQGLSIRYGIYDGKPKSVTETAKIMEVSEEYAEMLNALAVNEIRKMYTRSNRKNALASQKLTKDSDIAMLNIGVYEYRKLQQKGVNTISQFINLSTSDVERIFDNSHDIAAIATLRDDLGYPLR